MRIFAAWNGSEYLPVPNWYESPRTRLSMSVLTFQQLQNNMFVRVGRSLIVNKRYIYVINLTEQQLILSGGDLKEPIVFYGQSKADSPQNISLAREGLRQLKELLENEKGTDNG